MPIGEEHLAPFLSHNLTSQAVGSENIALNETIVIAMLRAADLPVDDWIDYPALIKSIIGMRSVGQYYATMTSDVNESGTNYGTRLVNQADRMVRMIIEGTLALEDYEHILQVEAEMQDSHEPFFTIGQVF